MSKIISSMLPKAYVKGLIIAHIILILFVLSLPLSYASGESVLRYKVRNPRVSRLNHTITILNEGKFTIEGVRLWVPIIKNNTPNYFVIIKNITASLPYVELETDPSGNIYVFWQVDALPPGKSFTAEITYSILSFNVQYMINADNVGSYSKESELYKKYTRPEMYIESNDPLILETAKAIAENETNPYILALKIANFVAEKLVYEVQNEEMGAKWALINGKGDCSEYSYLFTALCRACGIPARVKAGFAFHGGTEKTMAGHMWAEYYLENYGWIPIDLVWGYICYQDNLHFSSLQSFPIKYPYDNFFIEFSAPRGKLSINAYQTIEIVEGSLEDFENFSLARSTYSAVSNVEVAESLYLLSGFLGAKVFCSSDVVNLEKALNNFDLTLQQSLETDNPERIRQANVQIEYILGLAERIILKCSILISLIALTITLIILWFMEKGRPRQNYRI